MKKLLFYKTKAGTFYICQSQDGRFCSVYDEESLGSYISINQTIDDLIQNATGSVLHHSTGELLDTSVLGLPEDPSEWEKARR